jgi:hypothetical protein
VTVLELASLPTDLESFRRSFLVTRRGKAEVLMINLFPDRRRLAADVWSVPGDIFTHAQKLSDMGYLHPKLFSGAYGSLPRNIVGDPAGMSFGVTDGIREKEPGVYVVSGWAILPTRIAAADDVFITCENQLGEPVVVALADMPGRRDDVAEHLHNDRYRWSGWMATFQADQLPPSLSQFKISAWAVDVEAGRVYKLEPDLVGRATSKPAGS